MTEISSKNPKSNSGPEMEVLPSIKFKLYPIASLTLKFMIIITTLMSLFCNTVQYSDHQRNTCMQNGTIDLPLASYSTVTSKKTGQKWLWRVVLLITLFIRTLAVPFCTFWFFNRQFGILLKYEKYENGMKKNIEFIKKQVKYLTYFTFSDTVFYTLTGLCYDPPPFPAKVSKAQLIFHMTVVNLNAFSLICCIYKLIYILNLLKGTSKGKMGNGNVPATVTATTDMEYLLTRFKFHLFCMSFAAVAIVFSFFIHTTTCISGFWSIFTLSEYIALYIYYDFHWLFLKLICNKFRVNDERDLGLYQEIEKTNTSDDEKSGNLRLFLDWEPVVCVSMDICSLGAMGEKAFNDKMKKVC